ncbi:MAG: VWA domain-containing protein [Planctomycetales bacterium]|nr:VWA domain-containing protein [Planctomycetales bacterium]
MTLEKGIVRGTRIKPQASSGQASKHFASEAKPVKELAKLNKSESDRRESLAIPHPTHTESKFSVLSESAPSAETYAPIVENEFFTPDKQPLSTFSIDVDTASYSNMRRFVRQGQMPPPDAVRVEELLNYFRYDYPQPVDGTPFAVALDHGPCPWQPRHELVRIGLKGKEIDRGERPASNLVFLVDTSGSMSPANKLPLVQQALKMLAESMTANDRIAIVTYAGTAGLALGSTTGDDQQAIMTVIDSLHAGGSTNGEAGIHLAYKLAAEHFVDGGTNRVILCTDGDFNVGVSGDDELVRIIQEKAKSHVFLSIFGFGMGNLKDAKLEQLADKGNGHYGYIDDQREARKVFVEELTGTLHTIAKDVKIQVEFNPRHVAAYRLIGYENRALAAQDFNDDKKDAGEIGAGHTVTALYEIVPIGVPFAPQPAVDPLKYQQPEKQPAEVSPASKAEAGGGSNSPEWLTVKLRYKQPDADQSVKLEVPLTCRTTNRPKPRPDFDWAAAVAEFGLLLRHSTHRGQANFTQVLELAETGLTNDKGGYRAEFVEIVKTVRQMPQAKSYEQPVPAKSGER